jgi:hypothetical protein
VVGLDVLRTPREGRPSGALRARDFFRLFKVGFFVDEPMAAPPKPRLRRP